MTKSLKRLLLLPLVCLVAAFTFLAFGLMQPTAAQAQGKQLTYSFDSALFVNQATASTAKLSCQEGYMYIDTVSDNEDGFFFSYDAPQDIESFKMDEYNYVKFKLKRNAACQGGRFQMYFWSDMTTIAYYSEFRLGAEFNDVWVEVTIDLRVYNTTEDAVYIKNLATGQETVQTLSATRDGVAFSGNMYSMRFNLSRGNTSTEKEAWVEYMAFFENKADADEFQGLAKTRLIGAEEALKGELAPAPFALSEYTEEKIVKLAKDYSEELLGINTEVLNYSYEYPTTESYGYIKFDARLCSAGLYHFVEDIELLIEPEPNEPVLYKFDNEEIVKRLLSQGKMSVEAYYLNGVMKIVQSDPYFDDGFWVLLDTVADDNRFYMQSYPIIQYRLNITGQGPSQLFFANYGSYYSYNIGYDEGEWLTVTFDTAKTKDAIRVVNEERGTVQYLDSVNPMYSTEFTPPAFRGLSDEFRFNFGRRSGLERSALVDYIGFFPTMEAANAYGSGDVDGISRVQDEMKKARSIDYAEGKTLADATNAAKLLVEEIANGAYTVAVDVISYTAPTLNKTKGALKGEAVLSHDGETHTVPFEFSINPYATYKQKTLYFGGEQVLSALSAGAGTSLAYENGLVVSGENRSFKSVGLDVADKANLGVYGYVKIGFAEEYTGAVGFTAFDGNVSKKWTAELSGEGYALLPLGGVSGLMTDFAVQLSGTGESTLRYIAFFERLEDAEAFTGDVGNMLGSLQLVEAVASTCYNEREAKRTALKAVERALPDGITAEILPVELVKPTKNDKGYFRFKVALTADSVFGAVASVSAEYVLPIGKITYYDSEEFYFNGESYGVSEKTLANGEIVTAELTFTPTFKQSAFLMGNDTFGVYLVNDELEIRAGDRKLLFTTNLAASTRGEIRLAVVFAENETILYVNGVAFASGTAIGARSGSSVFYVGGSESETPFDGTMGEIKLWNTVRTETEISHYLYETMQGTEGGLLAYWRMKNDRCDFTNRVDGANPLAYVEAYEHYYHEFTGYDYLESTKSVAYTPKTVELWVKAARENEGEKTLLTNNLYTPNEQTFGLYTTATGGLVLRYGLQTVEIDDLELYDGRWNHIAFTFGNSGTAFYLNGELYDTYDTVCSGALGAAKYYFATDTTANSEGYGEGKFVGCMANVRFWSVERSASEIAADRRNLLASGTQNLLWNLTLDVSKELVFADDSSSENDVKIVSESWFKIVNEETEEYWTSVILPDPQDYAVASSTRQGRDWLSYDEWRFYNFNMIINDWILDNKTRENIELVLTVGDLTQNATLTEWEVVQEHFSMLDGVVPYTLVLGNHDLQSAFGYGSDTRGSKEFNTVFKYDEWKEKDYYGGSFEEGNLDNTYYKFEIRGEKYMVICLEFDPRDEVLEWFDYVVKKHSDYKVIVTTHENLNSKGQVSADIPNYGLANKDGATTNVGVGIWNKLVKDNPNVLQVVSGHVGTGLQYLTTENASGNTVQHIMGDTWSTAIAGNPKVEGLVLLTRYYDDGRVSVRLYDPTKNCYYVSGLYYEEDMSEERGL